MKFTIASACAEDKLVKVTWNDGHTSRFYNKWLRYYCCCKTCKPGYKATYVADLTTLPDVLTVAKVVVDKKGEAINVEINGEIIPGHVIQYDSQWLRQHCYCDACLDDLIDKRDVISKNGASVGDLTVREVEYQNLLDDPDRTIFRICEEVILRGCCLVKNVPCEDNKSLEVVRMLAPITETCFGVRFDVDFSNSQHGNNNPTLLPFHMDCTAYEQPAGFFFLHCLRFDETIRGGESKLTDLFDAAETLRKESPEHFKTLSEVPASWDTYSHHLSHPAHLEHQKCHIELDYFDKIVAVNWSPGLVGPLRIKEKDVERFYKARTKFSEIINREENQIVFRLQAGDVIVVNNRRVAHARTKIDNKDGGERHLQGSYANIDDVRSKYMQLAAKLGIDVVQPKIGNRCSF